jgi:hypothetical protein
MTEHTKTWFDLLFDEYKARGEAMFAFSQKQVEEAFEGDLAVTWEQVQTEWVSYGAGLLVKRSAYIGFLRRMKTDFEAWESKQPEVRVQYSYTDTWDRPCYKVVSHGEGAPVTVGQVLKDVELLPVGEAVTLYDHYQGEPNGPLDIRVVYVEPLNTTEDSAAFVHEEA